MLWSGLFSRVGASHGVNRIASFPRGKELSKKNGYVYVLYCWKFCVKALIVLVVPYTTPLYWVESIQINCPIPQQAAIL